MFSIIITLLGCAPSTTEEEAACPPSITIEQMEVAFEDRNSVMLPEGAIILGVSSCDWDENLQLVQCDPVGYRENDDGSLCLLSGGESTITYMVK